MPQDTVSCVLTASGGRTLDPKFLTHSTSELHKEF